VLSKADKAVELGFKNTRFQIEKKTFKNLTACESQVKFWFIFNKLATTTKL